MVMVGTLLVVAGTPAFAAQKDGLGRTVPSSIAGGGDDALRVRSGDVSASDAGEATSRNRDRFGQMGRKLGRGLANASTGWIELPKVMVLMGELGDPIFSDPVFGMVLGSFHGLEMSVVRTLAGAYEAATFPVPLPAGYAPVVSPTFVFRWQAPYLRSLR